MFSSPLGFSELFNEFRLQEGLNSLDDILNAIINSEGMSFNDLKPIYKEFLLKLAVTLTKDELYQRSKSIMRRQKKKLLRRNKAYQVNIVIYLSIHIHDVHQKFRFDYYSHCTYKIDNEFSLNLSFQYPRTFFFGSYGLKRVFRFSKYFFQKRKKTSAASLDAKLAKKRVINSSSTITNNHHHRQHITEIHTKQNYISSKHRKAVTSGSELSESHHPFQNRNSSSG